VTSLSTINANFFDFGAPASIKKKPRHGPLLASSAHADVALATPSPTPNQWQLRWPQQLPFSAFESIEVRSFQDVDVHWSGFGN
jgi:hypothetical protein